MNKSTRNTAHRVRRRVLAVALVLCTAFVMMPLLGDSSDSYAATSTKSSVSKKIGGASISSNTMTNPDKVTSSQSNILARRAAKLTSRKALLTGSELSTGSSDDYRYSKLTSAQKRIYNAMLTLAEDPYSGSGAYYATSTNSRDDGTTDNDWSLAYFSLIYDHAELYWLWMDDDQDAFAYDTRDTGSSFQYYMYLEPNSTDGYYDDATYQPVRIFTDESGWKSSEATFEAAVNSFLADIDMNHSDAVIAMEIHDKLCSSVTYNWDATEDTADYFDAAHTAYGALVGKSPVCDGYSLAYEYLLKKCGIDANTVLGYVGDPDEDGHAWNLVKLDGSWYEVDCTWDDNDTSSDPYMHDFLFITTSKISSPYGRNPGHTRDGSYFGYVYEELSSQLPTATATHFNPDYMAASGTTLADNTDSTGAKVTLAAVSGKSLVSSTAAPYASSGTWNLSVARASGLTEDVYVYSATGTAVSSSLLSAPTWNASAGTLSTTVSDKDSLSSLNASGNSTVSAKVEYDNGSYSTVSSDLSVAAASAKASTVTYNGKARGASLKVTDALGNTIPSTAYTAVLASNAVKPGIYASAVTFGTNPLYSENDQTLTAWMKIRPKTPSVSTASLSGRKLTVRWSKSTAKSGVQVQISTKKSFTSSSTKTYTVKGSSAVKLLKTLSSTTKSGRTLKYVRVRAYSNAAYHGLASVSATMAKDGSSVKIYSKWSKVKTAAGAKAA